MRARVAASGGPPRGGVSVLHEFEERDDGAPLWGGEPGAPRQVVGNEGIHRGMSYDVRLVVGVDRDQHVRRQVIPERLG